MSDDKHKEEIEVEVEETIEQPAPAVEENPEGSELEEDELKKPEPEDNPEVDYEKELVKVQATLNRAEKKIVKLKKDGEGEPVDVESMEERLQKRQDEGLAEIRKEALGANLDNAVEAISSGPAESKLIKHHLEHSVRSSGDLKTDVMRAKILANEKKVINQVDVLKQALISKNTAGAPSFGGQKQKIIKKVQATPEDIRIANSTFGGDVERYLKFKNK